MPRRKPAKPARRNNRFTAERRERLLTLLETGRTVREACADVGISQTTVGKWAARGRAGGNPDEIAFAQRLDEIRAGAAKNRLTPDDLVRLLETAARKGSVQAIRLLLERPWEKTKPDGQPHDGGKQDPFEKLDELAPRREARTAN